MSDHSHLLYSFPRKVLGSAPRSVAKQLVDRRPAETSALTLRLLDPKDDTFNSTAYCRLGTITVDTDDVFRTPLLESQQQIVLSEGSREVLFSELHFAGRSRSIWSFRSATEVVRGYGAPADCAPEILAAVGLGDSAERPLKELGECGIARLEIVSALYSKSKYVVLDRPFASISPKYVEDLATLMLSAIRDSERCLIITGVERLPKAWKSSDLVYSMKDGVAEGGHVFRRRRRSVSAVRALMHNPWRFGHNRPVLTRPQTFAKPPVRAAIRESVQTEAIENPKLSEIFKLDSLATEKTEDGPAAGSPQVEGRKRPGELTGVSKLSKLGMLGRCFRLGHLLKQLYRSNPSVVELVTARSVASEMSTQIRMGDSLRRQRLRWISCLAASISAFGIWLLIR